MIALSKVIALPTMTTTKAIAKSRVNFKKNRLRRLREIHLQEAIEKSPILLSQLLENNIFERTKIIPYFDVPIIFPPNMYKWEGYNYRGGGHSESFKKINSKT